MKKREIILWAIIAISILLFISNLGLGGIVGEYVSKVFFGIFGLLAYVFPFVLILGGFFAIANKSNKRALLKIICASVFFFLICSIVHLITCGSLEQGPIEAFFSGYYDKEGGGIVGGTISTALSKGFGLIGAYVILIVLGIIDFIVISGKNPLSSFFTEDKQKSRKKYADEKKKEFERNREKKKKEKLERKAREAILAQESKIQLEEEKRLKGFSISDANESNKEAEIDLAEFEEATHSKHSLYPLGSEQPVVESVEMAEPESEPEPDTEIISEPEPEIIPEREPESELTLEPEPEVTKEPEPELEVEPEIVQELEPEITPEVELEQEIEIVPEVELEPEIVSETEPEIIPDSELEDTSEPVLETEPEIEPELELELEPEPNVSEEDDGIYKLPPVELLKQKKPSASLDKKESLEATANTLATTLKNFGVDVEVTDYSCGPAVTRFEITPKMGVKVSKILNLSDDIKLNLAATDIRIEAPIPGKSAVGIEVPNKEIDMVSFRELVESDEFNNGKSKIAFAAGRDIGGNVVISDIAKMPHLLIAGSTGSGKSVCINTIIMSILYRANPNEVKFIMIDPKVVELSVYNGIPHLLIPVVSDPKKAAGALNWAVKEMMDRYDKFAQRGVRDMAEFNSHLAEGEKPLPQIVVIVDELADLMMVASSEVEEAICRLAQLARAAGIHLIIATQRPSVNVITGLIKANMPSRIAFAVTSGVDSRTILDMVGAEKLLGKGDMLYYPHGAPKPLRVQGAFVSVDEINEVVEFIKSQSEGGGYDEEIQKSIDVSSVNQTVQIASNEIEDDGRDDYFERAGKLIIEKEKGSIGFIQRNFKVGFNRAARIMDQLEEAGVVGPEEGTKPRTVLMTIDEFNSMLGIDSEE